MADYSGVVPGSKIKNTPTLYIAWFYALVDRMYIIKSNMYTLYIV